MRRKLGGVKVVVNWMPLLVEIDSKSRDRRILLWSCLEEGRRRSRFIHDRYVQKDE